MAPGLVDGDQASAGEQESKRSLTATYTSSNGSKAFVHAISAPLPSRITSTDAKQKTAYLSELRKSTRTLQEEINVFLTQKMGEDKQKAAGADRNIDEKAADEVEEENYGEEGVEEEEAG